MTIRHPEKINKDINKIPKKPSWIRVKAPISNSFLSTKSIINNNKLVNDIVLLIPAKTHTALVFKLSPTSISYSNYIDFYFIFFLNFKSLISG